MKWTRPILMTRDELTQDTAETIAILNEKVREALVMGKPGEAVDYAAALSSAAYAYDSIALIDRDDD